MTKVRPTSNPNPNTEVAGQPSNAEPGFEWSRCSVCMPQPVSMPWARCKRQPSLMIAEGLLGQAHLRQIEPAPQAKAPKSRRNPSTFHTAV